MVASGFPFAKDNGVVSLFGRISCKKLAITVLCTVALSPPWRPYEALGYGYGYGFGYSGSVAIWGLRLRLRLRLAFCSRQALATHFWIKFWVHWGSTCTDSLHRNKLHTYTHTYMHACIYAVQQNLLHIYYFITNTQSIVDHANSWTHDSKITTQWQPPVAKINTWLFNAFEIPTEFTLYLFY
jgi:hypothetical protein